MALKVKKGALGKLLGVGTSKKMQPSTGHGYEDAPLNGVQDAGTVNRKTQGSTAGPHTGYPDKPLQTTSSSGRMQSSGGKNYNTVNLPSKYTVAPYVSNQVEMNSPKLGPKKYKTFKPLKKI